MQILKTLLKDVVTFGKGFSQLTIIGQLASMAVLIFAGYQLTSCDKTAPTDNINIVAKQTTEYVSTVSDSITKLNDGIVKKEVEIKKLEFIISSTKMSRIKLQGTQIRLDSVRNAAKDTTTLVAIQDSSIANLKMQVAIADTIISRQDTVIAQKDTVIDLLKTSLVLSESKADTLQKTLDYTIKQHNKKDKLFGFIPLPTRKFIAIAGFIGGAYIGTQLTR
jgi:hypothetical protein